MTRTGPTRVRNMHIGRSELIKLARRNLLLAGAATALVPHRQSAAQSAAQPADYPNRPLKILVASPVGGLTDNFARRIGFSSNALFRADCAPDTAPAGTRRA